MVPLGGPIEQPGQQVISVHRAAAGDRQADHLVRHRARRIDPDMLSVDHDRFARWIAEAHRQLGRPGLHQGAFALRAVDHRIVDHLHEVGL